MRFADREREPQSQAQPAPKLVEEQEGLLENQERLLATNLGRTQLETLAQSPERHPAGLAQLSPEAPMSLRRFAMEEAFGAEAAGMHGAELGAEAHGTGGMHLGGMDTGGELIGHELAHVQQQQGGAALDPEQLAADRAENRQAREARMAALGEGPETEVESGGEGGGGAAVPYAESAPVAEGAAPAAPYAESAVIPEELEQ